MTKEKKFKVKTARKATKKAIIKHHKNAVKALSKIPPRDKLSLSDGIKKE